MKDSGMYLDMVKSAKLGNDIFENISGFIESVFEANGNAKFMQDMRESIMFLFEELIANGVDKIEINKSVILLTEEIIAYKKSEVEDENNLLKALKSDNK